MMGKKEFNYETGGYPELNVAFTCEAEDLLGPGMRRIVWVQGCLNRCDGCISPEWREMVEGKVVKVEELAKEILDGETIEGLTISGGEPMLQAVGLSKLIQEIREKWEISVIVFTGNTLEELKSDPPGPGIYDLLGETDVLIAGGYEKDKNDGAGLRGSTNQTVHYFGDLIPEGSYDFEGLERKAEIQIADDGEGLVLGIPPTGLIESIKDGEK